jgi:serine/threonine-protein kinase
VDGRSDLYSLGCVAFWLLTGTAVFKGRTAVETMMMHVHVKPDPPSDCTDRPIPPELDSLVLACLSKDPAARPQTADELAAQLACVRTGNEWSAGMVGHAPACDRADLDPSLANRHPLAGSEPGGYAIASPSLRARPA